MGLNKAIVASVLAVFALSAPAWALPVVDGSLADWGVTVADNNGSTFVFSPGIGLLGWQIEDQSDTAGDGGYLGPNYGGQNYDAEMMAVAYGNNRLYLAIVTGQRPDNGFERYSPGDIRIETAAGRYGIEVGGGAGGGIGTALAEGAGGSTYAMNGNGYTVAHNPADALQTTGSVWKNVNWLNDPIAPQEPVQFAITAGSVLAGTADYVYTRDTVTAQHAIIELSLDLSAFGDTDLYSIHWRPGCGNDELDVLVNLPVPEPGMATLAVLGLGGLVLRRRR